MTYYVDDYKQGVITHGSKKLTSDKQSVNTKRKTITMRYKTVIR